MKIWRSRLVGASSTLNKKTIEKEGLALLYILRCYVALTLESIVVIQNLS